MRRQVGEHPRLCVLERHDFSQWRVQASAGAAAGLLPYGLEALADRFDLWHADASPGRAITKVFEALNYHGDREVTEVAYSLKGLRSSDACLSIFEDFALTYSFLHRKILRLPPLFVISCWISQRLLTFAHKQRELLRRMADVAQGLTVFSDNQVALLRSRLGLQAAKIHVLDFGVVADYFTPAEGEERYFAAIGQDAGRDWETFFKAAQLVPETRFRVAAWPSDLQTFCIPENVEVLGGISTPSYRELLRGARAVVVCTHALPYPTGQSVMLEAASCRKPVIVTRTPAMRRYISATGALAVAPGDPSELATSIRLLDGSTSLRQELGQQGREAVLQHFESRRMWATVGALLSDVIERG